MPVIFVTGATSGFGAATARLFAQNGWQVVATGRRRERLKALKTEFPAGRIHIAEMDLTDRDSIVAAVAGLPEAFKPVTCLFNNGGLALGNKAIPNVDLADWQRMIDTNISGLIHTTLELLPLLKAAGRGASIINTGSVAQRWAYEGGNVYGGTKAFVHQFSLGLRSDLHGTGVRVTSIEPGMAETEFTLVRTGSQQASDTLYAGAEPMTGEDIAETLLWVATLPPHLNINTIELMPVNQSFAGFQVHRG